MNNNIKIKNVEDYRDKSGILGKAVLNAEELISVYTVSDKSKFTLCNINIVNPTLSVGYIKVYITKDKTPDLIDLFESKIVLEPDAVYSRTSVVLSQLESIYVESNIGNVVVRVEGFENNSF